LLVDKEIQKSKKLIKGGSKFIFRRFIFSFFYLFNSFQKTSLKRKHDELFCFPMLPIEISKEINEIKLARLEKDWRIEHRKNFSGFLAFLNSNSHDFMFATFCGELTCMKMSRQPEKIYVKGNGWCFGIRQYNMHVWTIIQAEKGFLLKNKKK
jgi:hypothetical protein